MSIHIHTIDETRHRAFISQNRRDPYTQEILKHEDRVVFCSLCKVAFLESSWQALDSKHCGQQGTLSNFSISPSEVRFAARPTVQQRTSSNTTLSAQTPRVQSPNPSSPIPGSESTSWSSCGCLLVFTLFILFGVTRCINQFSTKSSDSNTSQIVKTPVTGTGFVRQEACGDTNPPGTQNFYPVFVNKTDSTTLNYIKQNYCGDAYVHMRESVNRESIQVASFLSKSKATNFANMILRDRNINSGEVGEPTQN